MFALPVNQVLTLETSDYDSDVLINNSDVLVNVSPSLITTRTQRLNVSGLPVSNYYLPTNYYYSADPMIYPTAYRNVSYLDINSDKELQKKSTRYFYSQLYNKYIPDSNSELLDFVRLGSNEISLVKSMKEAKSNTTIDDEYSEKINYLADYVFTKTDVFSALLDFVNQRRINWWDLRYHSDKLETILVNKVKSKIRDILIE